MPILLTCYVKNKGAPIALKICTIVVWTSPDTMVTLVFRNYDVMNVLRPLAHFLHENSKYSDCAKTRHRLVERRSVSMAMSVLRENDVITLPRPLYCYMKNKGAQISMKICTIVVWTSPDTMVVLVFRNYDVIALPRPLAHLLHKKSKCSDRAET